MEYNEQVHLKDTKASLILVNLGKGVGMLFSLFPRSLLAEKTVKRLF